MASKTTTAEDKKTKAKETFGQRMRTVRTKAGFTQHEVAEKLGCWVQQYNAYECDRRVPTLGRALQIAAAFGTTVDKLCAGLELREE